MTVIVFFWCSEHDVIFCVQKWECPLKFEFIWVHSVISSTFFMGNSVIFDKKFHTFFENYVSKINYFLKTVVWSRKSENGAWLVISVSMQNLRLIIILFKKVVSLHLLIFRDCRHRTQHFHLNSRECCSVLVYKSFQNNIYVSHICCILKGSETRCSLKRLVWSRQKHFREDHHPEVVFWIILTSNPNVDFSSVPFFVASRYF